MAAELHDNNEAVRRHSCSKVICYTTPASSGRAARLTINIRILSLWSDFSSANDLESMISVEFLKWPVILLAFLAVYLVRRNRVSRLQSEKHGSQPAIRYKHVDPIFGLDIFVRTGHVMATNQLLPELQKRYITYGHTFESLSLGNRTINSIHPDNLRAVFAQNAADWGVEPIRLRNMHPFCGSGFITTDGSSWKRSHAMLRSGFHKSIISNLTSLEQHLGIMLEQIPKDGSKFDLQPYLLNLVRQHATMTRPKTC